MRREISAGLGGWAGLGLGLTECPRRGEFMVTFYGFKLRHRICTQINFIHLEC